MAGCLPAVSGKYKVPFKVIESFLKTTGSDFIEYKDATLFVCEKEQAVIAPIKISNITILLTDFILLPPNLRVDGRYETGIGRIEKVLVVFVVSAKFLPPPAHIEILLHGCAHRFEIALAVADTVYLRTHFGDDRLCKPDQQINIIFSLAAAQNLAVAGNDRLKIQLVQLLQRFNKIRRISAEHIGHGMNY